MLTDLVVEDAGVIERAELSLGPGSCALTGETGAGKTLVVASLGLLLGGRADRALVRAGAARAEVQGRFRVRASHRVGLWLRERDLLEDPADASGEVEVVVSRSIGPDGRTKARINGSLVPAVSLAEVTGALVEIAGQREHARLGEPAAQREHLDAFAGEGVVDLARRVAQAVRAARDAGRAEERLARDGARRRVELEALEAEVAEIEAAAPRPGEASALEAEARRLENAEAIAAAMAKARHLLRREGGAHEAVAAAADALEGLGGSDDGAARLADRLRSAALELDDVAQELAATAPTADPEALEAARDRLATLARLRRRYGVVEDAGPHLESARSRAEGLRSEEARQEDLARRAGDLNGAAVALAGQLSEARRAAAERLERELPPLLDGLALPGARVEVSLEPRELYEGGLESVEIAISFNPGEPPAPLAKVASGGELARATLALRLLTGRGDVGTLVFDEIDAGVGGEAARAVGACLADLSRSSGAQVIVVTHLPQVAAFADTHLVVAKEVSGDRTTARVRTVEGEERVAELSRMLAGLPFSTSARGHARELLEMAAAKGSG
ncbi:MAG TPA: DNA repair protein RecN [Actinomycetota bacterium]|nr:DNA repair protein RecN [Actinomycetota bacterium]